MMNKKLLVLLLTIPLVLFAVSQVGANNVVGNGLDAVRGFANQNLDANFEGLKKLGRKEYLVFTTRDEVFRVNKKNFKVEFYTNKKGFDPTDAGENLIPFEEAERKASDFLKGRSNLPSDKKQLVFKELQDHGVYKVFTFKYGITQEGVPTPSWEIVDINASTGTVLSFLANYDLAQVDTKPKVSELEAMNLAVSAVEKENEGKQIVIKKVQKPELSIWYDGDGNQVLRYIVVVRYGWEDSPVVAARHIRINALTGEPYDDSKLFSPSVKRDYAPKTSK